jgi:hypothetical protein
MSIQRRRALRFWLSVVALLTVGIGLLWVSSRTWSGPHSRVAAVAPPPPANPGDPPMESIARIAWAVRMSEGADAAAAIKLDFANDSDPGLRTAERSRLDAADRLGFTQAVRNVSRNPASSSLNLAAESPAGTTSLLVTELGVLRQAARMLLWRMREQSESGDAAGLAQTVSDTLGFGAAVSHQSYLLSRMAGLAIQGSTFDQLGSIIEQRNLPRGAADLIAAHLENVTLRSWRDTIAHERSHLTYLIKAAGSNPGSMLTQPDHDAVEEAFTILKPIQDATTIQELAVAGLNASNRLATPMKSDPVAVTAARSIADSIKLDIDHHDRLARLQLMIATESFRERRGKLPSNVEEVAPGFLREIPRLADGSILEYVVDESRPIGYRLVKNEPGVAPQSR